VTNASVRNRQSIALAVFTAVMALLALFFGLYWISALMLAISLGSLWRWKKGRQV
jgi:hypothetical protein